MIQLEVVGQTCERGTLQSKPNSFFPQEGPTTGTISAGAHGCAMRLGLPSSACETRCLAVSQPGPSEKIIILVPDVKVFGLVHGDVR